MNLHPSSRDRARVFALVAACGLGGAAPALAGGPELTLIAGASAASLDAAPDSELSWGAARLAWGDRLQLRAEIAWLDAEGEGSLAPPGLGPVAPVRRGKGPGGNGSGPGSEAAGSTLGASTGEATEPASPAAEVRGWGDLRLGAAYRLAGGGARLYRIDLGAAVKFPTADEQERLGTGELDARIGLSGEYRFWSLTLFGGAGFNHFGEPAGAAFDDVLDAYLGVESQPIADRILLSGWLEGHPEVVEGGGAYSALGVGLRTLGSVRFELQGRTGLGDTEGDWSLSFGVSFGLRPPGAGPSGVRR